MSMDIETASKMVYGLRNVLLDKYHQRDILRKELKNNGASLDIPIVDRNQKLLDWKIPETIEGLYKLGRDYDRHIDKVQSEINKLEVLPTDRGYFEKLVSLAEKHKV